MHTHTHVFTHTHTHAHAHCVCMLMPLITIIIIRGLSPLFWTIFLLSVLGKFFLHTHAFFAHVHAYTCTRTLVCVCMCMCVHAHRCMLIYHAVCSADVFCHRHYDKALILVHTCNIIQFALHTQGSQAH